MKIIEGQMGVAASNVANFLECQELTQLDLRAARGRRRRIRSTWGPWTGAARSTIAGTDSVTLCRLTTDPTDAPLFRLLIEPNQATAWRHPVGS
jgi:hypothetical protein